jgi:hypothetical protein
MASYPSLTDQVNRIEAFIQQQKINAGPIATGSRLQQITIKIPVVVHILYHQSGENISDEVVSSQIDMLNKTFRKKNADTANIPAAFKSR